VSPPVSSAIRVQSPDTVADSATALVRRGPRLRVCAQPLLRSLHACDVQAENQERRPNRRLGRRNRVEKTTPRKAPRLCHANHRRYDIRGVLERSAIPSQEAEPARQQEASLRRQYLFEERKRQELVPADSHHSLKDGAPNPSNIRADTSANRMLFSNDFTYWGGAGPQIPARFLNYGSDHISLLVGRNHKNNFPPAFVEQFVAWIRSRGESGYLGEPLDWCRTP